MGRKKLQIENVDDERVRRVMFKKRRVGLLKKAMQLSKLTNAMVDLRIYQPDDGSLVEYISSEENDFSSLTNNSENVLEYSKLQNKHYRLIINLEQRVNNYRNHNNLMEQFQNLIGPDFHEMTEGINMLSIFSLAKSKSCNNNLVENTGLTGKKRSFEDSIIGTSESGSKEEKKKMKLEDEPLKSSVEILEEKEEASKSLLLNQEYQKSFEHLRNKLNSIVNQENEKNNSLVARKMQFQESASSSTFQPHPSQSQLQNGPVSFLPFQKTKQILVPVYHQYQIEPTRGQIGKFQNNSNLQLASVQNTVNDIYKQCSHVESMSRTVAPLKPLPSVGQGKVTKPIVSYVVRNQLDTPNQQQLQSLSPHLFIQNRLAELHQYNK